MTLTHSLLWDVEIADALSAGCAAHQDAACLCDVDLSLTQDIVYDTPPKPFLDVDDLDSLVAIAADVLAADQVKRAIEKLDMASAYNLTVLKQADALTADQIDFIIGEYMWAPVVTSRDDIGELLGVFPETVALVLKMSGAEAYEATRHSRARQIAMARYYNEGLPIALMVEKMQAEGFPETRGSVETWHSATGRKSHSSGNYARAKRWELIEPLVGTMNNAEIARHLGFSLTTVQRDRRIRKAMAG